MEDTNYFTTGIYTIPEAARLVGTTPARIRGWISGHPGSKSKPVIRAELPKIGKSAALGFKNLIEARFIRGFAKHGLSIQSIRVMADEARNVLRDEHPFAKDVLFKTDGEDIFAEIIDRASERTDLYNLRNHNYAIENVLKPFLKEPVEFDEWGNAKIWHPRRKKAPHVVVTPNFAFGHPVMEQTGVPTSVLVDALIAEDYNYRKVANWYEVSIEEIKEAEKFESLLYGTA